LFHGYIVHHIRISSIDLYVKLPAYAPSNCRYAAIFNRRRFLMILIVNCSSMILGNLAPRARRQVPESMPPVGFMEKRKGYEKTPFF
jgi:hypothetical protein